MFATTTKIKDLANLQALLPYADIGCHGTIIAQLCDVYCHGKHSPIESVSKIIKLCAGKKSNSLPRLIFIGCIVFIQ